MGKQYSHLSFEERAVLQVEASSGASIRSIARRLKRSVSTLSPELGRQDALVYTASLAGERYRLGRRRNVRKRRIVEGSELFQSIRDDLVLYRWSPQQITAKLKAMHPNDPTQRASHETICAAIYAHPRGGLKKEAV